MIKCINCPVKDVEIFGIIVKYGTRQVRDVDIMQYYDGKYETLRPPLPPPTHKFYKPTLGPDVRQLETL